MKKTLATLASVAMLALTACADKPLNRMDGVMPEPHKASAPITLSFSTPAQLELQQSDTVTVTVSPNQDVENLSLSITADEGLYLEGGPVEVSFGSQASGTELSQEVKVTVHSEGLMYLNVYARGTFAGKDMGRSGVVPVQVGSDKSKNLRNSGKTEVDSTGQVISVSPAQE